MNKLTTMVTSLSKQVEELQGVKSKVDEFLGDDVEAVLKAFAEEYLTNNLQPITENTVVSLIEPIKTQLNQRIKHTVEKMLGSTTFYLQTSKPPKPPADLTAEELKAMLQVQLSFQKDMTPEEQAIYDALQAGFDKEETCI